MKEKIEKSTGNVFADLGLDDADEMMAKAKLASCILDVIEKRGLTQSQAASLLGTDQSYISKLKIGSALRHFTFDRLLHWLNRLDRNIVLTIKNKSQKQDQATIRVAGA